MTSQSTKGSFGAALLLVYDCPDGSVYCLTSPDGPNVGTFKNQVFFYNFAVCLPCTPYGNNQPDGCSTAIYWK